MYITSISQLQETSLFFKYSILSFISTNTYTPCIQCKHQKPDKIVHHVNLYEYFI